ncbi:GL12683 [Drosophila persimilis]|uniref:GL12683 n=1 Tax=Drosophila persimilis TaxID=7234 RepID=B4HDQ3_DROPE|nr:GL12683 [Drosophila persimilis]
MATLRNSWAQALTLASRGHSRVKLPPIQQASRLAINKRRPWVYGVDYPGFYGFSPYAVVCTRGVPRVRAVPQRRLRSGVSPGLIELPSGHRNCNRPT